MILMNIKFIKIIYSQVEYFHFELNYSIIIKIGLTQDDRPLTLNQLSGSFSIENNI